jgi:peptide-methionine (S)-S-oxide reductase
MKLTTILLRRAACVLLLGTSTLLAAEFPDPIVDNKSPAGAGKQTAVLAGGCFWCVEAVFQQIEGVEKVVSGYSGGDAASAHYAIVSTGRTGHAESVQVTYDPRKISYGQLLKVFFDVAHDPTQRNRQGPDVGPQYRSADFTWANYLRTANQIGKLKPDGGTRHQIMARHRTGNSRVAFLNLTVAIIMS